MDYTMHFHIFLALLWVYMICCSIISFIILLQNWILLLLKYIPIPVIVLNNVLLVFLNQTDLS